MQKRFLVMLLSFVFVLGFSVDAEAQRTKKRKTKERPSTTEQTDDTKSSRSRDTGENSGTSSLQEFFANERLVYDIMGNFGLQQFGGGTAINIGLKPAISYKILPKIHLGFAPKIQYYFVNLVGAEDLNFVDYGFDFFSRFVLFDVIYLQAGYDFNNLVALLPTDDRDWRNGPMIGGGYLNGFGPWRYGIQALFEFSEELRDYDNFPLEIWVGFSYNL